MEALVNHITTLILRYSLKDVLGVKTGALYPQINLLLDLDFPGWGSNLGRSLPPRVILGEDFSYGRVCSKHSYHCMAHTTSFLGGWGMKNLKVLPIQEPLRLHWELGVSRQIKFYKIVKLLLSIVTQWKWKLVTQSCLADWPARLLCPWNPRHKNIGVGSHSGKNTGVGSHFLRRYLPDPGIEPGSPALQADSLPPDPQSNTVAAQSRS